MDKAKKKCSIECNVQQIKQKITFNMELEIFWNQPQQNNWQHKKKLAFLYKLLMHDIRKENETGKDESTDEEDRREDWGERMVDEEGKEQ